MFNNIYPYHYVCQKCYCSPCMCPDPITTITDGGTWKFVGDIDYEKIREIIREEVMKATMIMQYGMETFDAYEEALTKAGKYDKLIARLRDAGLEFEDE